MCMKLSFYIVYYCYGIIAFLQISSITRMSYLTGSDRVNLTITIHSDNIPELDESFVVELTNVTEENERLRTGAVSHK